MNYELVIIGGGPAGVAAGIYAARKKIKTLLITESFGGQSLVSPDVQNWIGETSISGFDLAKKMETHLRSHHDGVDIITGDLVEKISRQENGFSLVTAKGKTLETKTILMASGGSRRKLDVPGEKNFEGKGVFYCSICDAPIMKNKKAVVIGGGNAGLEAVIDLVTYADQVFLLHRRNELKGDAVTQEKIGKNPKVQIILNAEIKEIHGSQFVEKISYLDKNTNEPKSLDVDGVFVEIGEIPNSHPVADLVNLNERKEIIVDHKTQQSSLTGIWAAGDVTDVLYKQNNISAGDAVKAVLNIYDYLNKTK